jgi:hypothetical protein
MGSCESTNFQSIPSFTPNMQPDDLNIISKPIIRELNLLIRNQPGKRHIINFIEYFKLEKIKNENHNNIRLLLASVVAGFNTPQNVIVTWLDRRFPDNVPELAWYLCTFEILIYKNNSDITHV